MDLVGNLGFIWHIIRASENLLACAIERSEGRLQEYYVQHLKEERGHADWLREDLLTVDLDITKTTAPIEAVVIVGSVYYMIFHVDACALLGYMKVLESWPLEHEKLRILAGKYPASLLRTVKYHAEHDPDHLKDLQKQIEVLNLDQKVLVAQTEVITRLNLTKALMQYAQAA
jgi:hypothetical protein